MEYCCMTTMFYSVRGCGQKMSVEDSLTRIARFGIRYVDLNMCAVGRFGEHQFDRDDWKAQAYGIRDLADKLGLVFVQTHLPYQGRLHRFDFFNGESYQHMKDCTLRAMEISNIVGAKWAVLHPVTDPGFPVEELDAQITENHRFYESVFQESLSGCCGLAFENMVPGHFGANVDDLVALIGSFGSEKVQATWDFGHANLVYGDSQDEAIRKIGPFLQAVHVNDNWGRTDDHFAPYQGSIDWDLILVSLAEVGFDGYWDFEIGKTYSNLPLELKDSAMMFYKDIASYMINRYEKVKRGL